MNTLWLVSYVILWGIVLATSFLLFGTLRSLGLLQWRLDELDATRPVRKGREGLPLGVRAPDFELPSAAGGNVALRDFTGHQRLLVFTQSGCGPCHDVAPELNRIHDKGELQVLVVNNGEGDDARDWATATRARFPVLGQEKFSVSKRYEVFATPFAFLIDEQGIVRSKGIAGSRQYLSYVLAGTVRKQQHDQADSDPMPRQAADQNGTFPTRNIPSVPSLHET
jgi:methylamine dehydrogenase accessory protein MauD